DGIAARRLRRAIERIRRGAPDRVMRRGAMRLQRRFVPIDFVEVIDVRVLLVVQHIEAKAARLVPLGAERIDLDRLQEARASLRLDPDLYPQRYHTLLLQTISSRLGYRRRDPGSSPR